MFSNPQWLALILALSATIATAAPNPDVVTVNVTRTSIAKAAYGKEEAHPSTTGSTAKTTPTPLPAGCPHWVAMLVAPDLQDKVCKKLPKVTPTPHPKAYFTSNHSTSSTSNHSTSSTSSHSTSSTSSHSTSSTSTSSQSASSGSHTGTSTTTVSIKKHPKPTGLPAGCPKWVEDYVALVNLDEACRLVAKDEKLSSTSSTTTTSASKHY